MKEIIYKDKNGNNVTASVLGFFKIEELNKEFVMYSIVDDNVEEDDCVILLGEVVREDDEVQILGIDENEKELVVAYYNEIASQIGGSNDE